jgi:hypothetical protein
MRSFLRLRTGATTAGLVLLGAALAPAGAQQLDSLRKMYQIQYDIPTAQMMQTAMRGAPGNSAGSTSAFGANWGDVFFGGGYQARTRYLKKDDATAVAGFGLGNAQKYVGLEVAVTPTSTFRDGFATSGTVSVKLHRILPASVGIAAGIENAAEWGGNDGGQSLFAVGSKSIGLREDPNGFLGSVVVNAGVGNGRYRSEDKVRADRTQKNDGVGVFGSFGLRLHPQASFIADWTGQDLALAASLVPFRSLPLVLTPGFADVTRTAGDGARFTLGVGMGFRTSDLTNFVSRGR